MFCKAHHCQLSDKISNCTLKCVKVKRYNPINPLSVSKICWNFFKLDIKIKGDICHTYRIARYSNGIYVPSYKYSFSIYTEVYQNMYDHKTLTLGNLPITISD